MAPALALLLAAFAAPARAEPVQMIGSTVAVNGTWTISTAAAVGTASPNFFLDRTGNIGLGTASPQATLDVENPAAAGSYVLAVSTSGITAPIVVVSTGGNVGIGTSSPSASLEVQGGAIKATGGLIIPVLTADPASPVTGQIWLVYP